MTRVDLNELERKAREATATTEPWSANVHSRYTDGWWPAGRCVQSKAAATADAEHIAANSPDVTIALVARIRELEAGLRTMLDSAAPHPVENPAMTEPGI